MSGSGSTIFGVFKDRNEATKGAASVTAETGINCIVTKTLE
jgi:4-diphosphocytidyl-2C-methyl-D-erythritol kinase